MVLSPIYKNHPQPMAHDTSVTFCSWKEIITTNMNGVATLPQAFSG
jgi:hypothetical protein